MDEDRPSISWTYSDDGPLKIWKCERRRMGGQIDESPSVEAWLQGYADSIRLGLFANLRDMDYIIWFITEIGGNVRRAFLMGKSSLKIHQNARLGFPWFFNSLIIWFIIFQLDTAIHFSEKLRVRDYPNNFLSVILLSVKFYSVNRSTGLISIINYI